MEASEANMDVVVITVEGGAVRDASHPYVICDCDFEAWDVWTLSTKARDLRELLRTRSVDRAGRLMIREYLSKLEAEIAAIKEPQ